MPLRMGRLHTKGCPLLSSAITSAEKIQKKIYSEGTEFQIGKIELVSNTGTYIDCPFHRYADGNDLSQVGLEALAELEGVYVDAVGQQSIGKDYFQNHNVKGNAILVNTNWSKHWRTDFYFENHPFLTEDAANYLVQAGAKVSRH